MLRSRSTAIFGLTGERVIPPPGTSEDRFTAKH
jgi:hypothetical protein